MCCEDKDSNAIDLKKCKGTVRVCEYCKPEETLLGRACPQCMSQGYLAVCLNCNGSGKVTQGAVWDGGKSSHTSVCTPCGGKGAYPARRGEYLAQVKAAPPPVPVGEFPKVVRQMENLQINRR